MSPAELREIVDRLRLYGHVHRLTLLKLLLESERSVGELDQHSGIGQPALSQQLAELRRAGSVEVTPKGKQKIYRLAPGEAERVAVVLDLAASGSASRPIQPDVSARRAPSVDHPAGLPRDRSGALFPRMLGRV